MRKDFQQNFNTLTNILILFILFFGGLTWADTNGVWQFANDTRGGTFGGDEQAFTSNYTFINPVYFSQPLKSLSNPNVYFINLDGRTQLNDLGTNKISSNSAIITGNLNVTNTAGKGIFTNSTIDDGIITTTSASGKSAISGYTTNSNSYSGFFDGNFVVNSGNLRVNSVANCPGKLYTDANGNVVCGTDNINDADFVIGNEYPLAGTGVTVSGRTVNVNTNTIATKTYVDSKVGGSSKYICIQYSCYAGCSLPRWRTYVTTNPTFPVQPIGSIPSWFANVCYPI